MKIQLLKYMLESKLTKPVGDETGAKLPPEQANS